MTTYSKRTRELAAQLCSMAASNNLRMYTIADELSLPVFGKPRTLAYDALKHVNNTIGFLAAANRYAEAEALIRTGWTP